MKGITHRLADCMDCEWRSEDYLDKNMPRKAKAHAEKTGHTVAYEVGYSITYQGIKK